MENSNFMTKKEKEKVLKKIKVAMTEAGISQTELAKKLGLTQAAVSAWFHGKGTPGMETLTSLADALHKPINYFFAEVKGSNNAVGNGAQVTADGDLQKDVKLLSVQVELLNAKIKLLEEEIKKMKRNNYLYDADNK